MIYLWNTQVGGWMTPGGSYSSDLQFAREYSPEESREIVARHYNKLMAQYGLIPVRKEDLPNDIG